MSERAGRPAMPGALAPLAVAKRLDLARQAVFLVDRDPLEHFEAFLKLGHLVTQTLVLKLRLPVIAAGHASAVGPANPAPEDRRDHDDCHYDDCGDLSPVHQVLSSSEI